MKITQILTELLNNGDVIFKENGKIISVIPVIDFIELIPDLNPKNLKNNVELSFSIPIIK